MIFQEVSCQESILYGTLVDNGEPLLFASVAVYRNDILIRGVETDLDGNYQVECQAGDRIEFSYIGYNAQSIIVTAEMLNSHKNYPNIEVPQLKSQAFLAQMEERRKRLKESFAIDSTQIPTQVIVKDKSILNNRIHKFSVIDGHATIVKPSKPIQFTAAITQKIGTQFVAPWHKHQLQNTYAQGRPIQGEPTYQDFSNGESFSYGPKISSLSNQNIIAHQNDLMQSGSTFSTHAACKTEQNNHKIYSIFNYDRSPDIFNTFQNSATHIRLGWNKYTHPYQNNNYVNVEFVLQKTELGNQNYTGYYHEVLQSMMIQSPSYDSQNQSPENPTSYSPDFNNPFQTLNQLSFPISNTKASLLINQKWLNDYDDLQINNTIRFDIRETSLSELRTSHKEGEETITQNIFHIKIPTLQFASEIKKTLLDGKMQTSFSNIGKIARSDYSVQTLNQHQIHNEAHLLRYLAMPNIDLQLDNVTFTLSNQSLIANNQPNSILNPTINGIYQKRLHKKKIDRFSASLNFQRKVKELDLVLDNYNYSSLLINHYELSDQQTNVPLWIPDNLNNETKDSYSCELAASKQFSKSLFTARLQYNLLDQKNVIFPILQNSQFTLQNAADFTTHKLAWIGYWKYTSSRKGKYITLKNTLEVNHFRTNVYKLHTSNERIPIAGFSNISKNLIEEQPVGVIVGSNYKKTENGTLLIDEDGFPIRSDKQNIIGDPTPLLSFNYNLEYRIDNWGLKIFIDGQLGGKIWNGTQQALDYYGTSLHTADHREVKDYIFEGVTSDGQINNKKVALANPKNGLQNYFWTRYGEEGVNEEYIKDGSHINLKLIELFYETHNYYEYDIKASVYVKNLLSIGSFQGFTTSHLYEDSISYGLQYFNQPIATEIGTSFTYLF